MENILQTGGGTIKKNKENYCYINIVIIIFNIL